MNMSMFRSDCKKQIIRNIEDVKPKTIVIELPEEPVHKAQTVVLSPEKEKEIPIASEINEPKLNTALCLKKKIKQVEETKPRKVKSLSDMPKSSRLTVDEKITKKLNFPYQQRLYKDLISLQLIDKPPPPNVTVTHEPIIKDRAPKLEDFYMTAQQEEYSIPVITTINCQPLIRHYNGLRLQQVIKSWYKVRPD